MKWGPIYCSTRLKPNGSRFLYTYKRRKSSAFSYIFFARRPFFWLTTSGHSEWAAQWCYIIHGLLMPDPQRSAGSLPGTQSDTFQMLLIVHSEGKRESERSQTDIVSPHNLLARTSYIVPLMVGNAFLVCALKWHTSEPFSSVK